MFQFYFTSFFFHFSAFPVRNVAYMTILSCWIFKTIKTHELFNIWNLIQSPVPFHSFIHRPVWLILYSSNSARIYSIAWSPFSMQMCHFNLIHSGITDINALIQSSFGLKRITCPVIIWPNRLPWYASNLQEDFWKKHMDKLNFFKN